MNLKQIREEALGVARDDGDIDSDRLWSKDDMNRYINRVYRRIAKETKCIRDAVTPAVCRMTVAPFADLSALTADAAINSWSADDLALYNDPDSWLYQRLVAPNIYTLHPSVIAIDEVKWLHKTWRLTKVSYTKWTTNTRWEQTPGMSTEYATDYSNGVIVINYRELTADTLKLIVRRMPLKELVVDADVPEIKVQYHDYFLNGVLEQMYLKQDSQTFDKDKSVNFGTYFKADLDEAVQAEILLNEKLSPNNSLAAFT